MDTDPPLTCDYIFVRGKCEIVSCMVDPASAKCHVNDPTIYASDHVAVLADLII
jgi:endonuclease/exonuclease/phosphatase family metal-dependent hydrolase